MENDAEEIQSFLNENPLALITTQGVDGSPVATQVPVVFDERDGHVMRNTDHWHGFNANPNVLCVFSGPNCHVSASWYTNKMSGSTWNYMSVHAQGTLRFLDQEGLINLLRRLTDQYENDPDSGSNFDDLEQGYVDKMVQAIQAFEITVSSLDAIFKLSQNRDEASYDNIIDKLSQREGYAPIVASIMEKRKPRLFNREG
jgi:transcriptional regulator